MMQGVFWSMVVLSILTAFTQGKAQETSAALLESAQGSVKMMLTMLGSMALWSGLMEILVQSGDVRRMGRLLRRMLGRTRIPDESALDDVGMNLAANMLGLGNAATPAGIRAAQKLAAQGESGLRMLAMLLVVNNSSVQILPTTVMTLRQAAGAANPADIWGVTMVSSGAATVTAIVLMMLCHSMQDRRRRRQNAACGGAASAECRAVHHGARQEQGR